MELEVNTVSTERFTHNRDNRALYADASDLPIKLNNQLYDDAADIGFAIYNPATQSITRWHWAEDQFNGGELERSVYRPTWETMNRYPKTKGYKVFVYND